MVTTTASVQRIRRLIRDAIARLRLDCRDLVVYTEAGTGPFAVTASLAACAGATRVFARARPWQGRGADAAAADTQQLAEALGVAGRVTIRADHRPEDFAQADVITNLGSVRPIDQAMIAMLKPTAVVPFMREAWELRDGDVDLDACRRRGIPVIATDEHHPDVAVFEYCGLLAAAMMLQAGLEISGNRVIVISRDPFGPALADTLQRLSAEVTTFDSIRAEALWRALPDADALIVADFGAREPIVDRAVAAEIAVRAPSVAVIAFAGGVDGAALAAAGITCVPVEGSTPGRMGRTLAALGPRPVIMLHAAGLKVGAEAARARARGLAGAALIEHVCRVAPAAPMPGHGG